MNFKEWLNNEYQILIEWELFLQEMAMGDIIRKPIIMDQDDADYMNQFLHDVGSWPRRLKERYNDKLDAALDSNQNIKPGTDKFTAKLIRKLRGKPNNLDPETFDMRNINPGSGSLAGFKLMQMNNAQAILTGYKKKEATKIGWIAYSAQQTGSKIPTRHGFGGRSLERRMVAAPSEFHFVPMPEPGDEMYGKVQTWSPNWTSRQSFGDPEYDPKRIFVSDTMKEQIRRDAEIGADKYLHTISDPNHKMHYAYKPLIQRKNELLDIIVDFILKNTKSTDWQDSQWRQKTANRITQYESKRDWSGGTWKHAVRTRKAGLDPTQIVLKTRPGRPRKAPELRTSDSFRKNWQLQQEYPPESTPAPSPEGYPYAEPPEEKMARFQQRLNKIKTKRETSAERLERWRKHFFPAKTG